MYVLYTYIEVQPCWAPHLPLTSPVKPEYTAGRLMHCSVSARNLDKFLEHLEPRWILDGAPKHVRVKCPWPSRESESKAGESETKTLFRKLKPFC